METQIVITSGKKYLDIDAYASIFAYRHLLKSLGYNALAYSCASPNESVPSLFRNMDFKFDEAHFNLPSKYIVLDVSNPEFFDPCVNSDNIEEIIDHHPGYEDYWQNKRVKNNIEFIGSVCTLIFERFEKYNKLDILNPDLCKLLIAGILDNTLNLKSNITSPRDIKAYEKLLKLGNIDSAFNMIYFNACYEKQVQTLKQDIKDSIKIEKVSPLLPEVFGQIIVLNKDTILDNLDKVKNAFNEYNSWLLNVISLEDGKSYLFYSGNLVKENLEKLFAITADKDYIELKNCMLRKEIMKKAKEFN